MKTSSLFAVLLFSFLSSAQTGDTEVKWLVHKDATFNVSIQYPSNWQLKPPNKNTLFFVTSYPESDKDYFRENLNCIIPSKTQEGLTIQMAEEEIVGTLSESLTDFKLIQSGYSTWNKVDAFEIEYTCTQAGNDLTYNLHILQKTAIIKGKLYALTYTSLADAYEKYIGTIRKMFASFKVL